MAEQPFDEERRIPMDYRTREQIERTASTRPITGLNEAMPRRERLARWTEILEQQPGLLRSIEGLELSESGIRRADCSPLSIAFADPILRAAGLRGDRSEEHTSELQSLMRISYAVFCLKKKKIK